MMESSQFRRPESGYSSIMDTASDKMDQLDNAELESSVGDRLDNSQDADDDLNLDSEFADQLYGPLEPVSVQASAKVKFGSDFEFDFESQPEEESSLPNESARHVREDSDMKFLWTQYQTGLWAPYPEFYLADDGDAGNEDVGVFTKLSKTMDLIVEASSSSRYIYKRIVKPGSGIPVGNKEIVIIHYAAYVEFGDEPVDIAYSRALKRPLKLQLDSGSALPGFEMAIKSMTQQEASIFIVSSSLAYGKVGCPPRYPANADIFYFVELVSIAPNDALEQMMKMSPEEREQLTFTAIKKVLSKCARRVKFFYQQAEYRRAQCYQRWAIDLLEHCHVANEEEDKQRLKLLCEAFSNGAVIAHKLKLPKAVMFHTGNVLRMNKNHRKALELRVLALIELKSTKEAHLLLRRALSLYPESAVFPALLKKIQADERKEKERELDLYKRMMGNMALTEAAPKVPAVAKSEQKVKINERSQKTRDNHPSPTSLMVEQMLNTLRTSDATEVELNMNILTLDDIKRLHENIKKYPGVEFVHDGDGCRLRKTAPR